MDSEKIFMELKKMLEVRKKGHQKLVLNAEQVCAFFKDIISKAVDPSAKMSMYIFPARQQFANPMGALFHAKRDPREGVIFACEFVIESPKFQQNCPVHMISDMRILQNEDSVKTVIAQITQKITHDPELHDTILYLKTEAFGHLWKDPLAEAQKEIIKANKKSIDDQREGDSWKGNPDGV